MHIKSIFVEIIETFVVSLVVLLLINTFIGAIEQVWGSSMEPNFYTSERILVDKITKRFIEFKRGEVIIINSPTHKGKHFIKRIIGVPGDIIKIYNCKVYVLRDGKKYEVNESYIPSSVCTKGGRVIKDGRSLRIDKGEYMVLGDNRDHSVDSREFDFLDKDAIVGRVVFRFWPILRIGFVR